MSEREPITAELRRVMNHTTMAGVPLVEIGEFEFGHRCDAIDAVHAGLERENAELRERVAVLDNQGESMHDGGSITDELRGYASMCDSLERTSLDVIADRIDAEHEGTIKSVMNDALYYANDKDMAELGWVRLPLDADGVPIRVGDEMVDELDESTAPRKVTGLYLANDGWWVYVGGIGCRPSRYRHHHAPTVEDVLREFADEMNQNLGMYTGEAIDADEWRDADNKTISEYAKRLTLAESE